MKPVINVGIIGFGVVGCGAYDILQRNAHQIELKVGSKVVVKRIVDLDIDTPRPVDVDKSIMSRDANDILNDPEIDIIVELIGGVKPAYDFIMTAIKNGKHVVTANKELIAKEGHSLIVEAGTRKQDLFFEASVGGGIPIIRPLKECLTGDKVNKIVGIVNGTTNYILTSMSRDQKDYAEALADAQARGYAESNPTNDVDGHDAAYKIAILASIGFTSRVDVSGVYREGIRNITQKDIVYAAELGYTIKLLAIAQDVNGAMQIRVHPTLIKHSHPLASVNDVFNAIYIDADPVGNVMFYGRGAGSDAAGSAVVGDVIDAARNINSGCTGRISCTCFDEKPMQSMDEVSCKHYIRMKAEDNPGVLANVTKVFAENLVGIQSVMGKVDQTETAEMILITQDAAEPSVRKSLETIKALNYAYEVSNWIRVED